MASRGENGVCSFCGKSKRMFEELIVGPDVYICDECVDLSQQIIDVDLGVHEPDTSGGGRTTPAQASLSQLQCSFCSKTQDQVKKLIAGPGVYICDECLALAAEIAEEERVLHRDRD